MKIKFLSLFLIHLLFVSTCYAANYGNIPQSLGSLMTERMEFSDGKRCSSWCETAKKEIGKSCEKWGTQIFVANCVCNEHQKPNFAEVQYECGSGKMKRRYSKKKEIRRFGMRSKETLHFYDKDGCSTWCDKGQKIAAPASCAAYGYPLVLDYECSCNENKDPAKAYLRYECGVETIQRKRR